MERLKQFIAYQELADALEYSYQQIQKVYVKRIIEIFDIDVSRLPKSPNKAYTPKQSYYHCLSSL